MRNPYLYSSPLAFHTAMSGFPVRSSERHGRETGFIFMAWVDGGSEQAKIRNEIKVRN